MAEMNQQKRNMIVVGGVMVVFIGAVVLYSYSNNQETVSPGAAQVAAVPNLQNVPASSDSEDYNNSVREFNDKKADEALKNNQTHVPTLTSDTALQEINPLDLLEIPKDSFDEEKELEQIQEIEREKLMPTIDIPQTQIIAPPQEAVQQTVIAPVAPQAKYGQQDFIILEALLEAQKISIPKPEFEYKGDSSIIEAERKAQEEALSNFKNNNVAGSTGNGSGNGSQEQIVLVKAGDILQAVLETEVNSKEPSAVLAKIVTGKYKGARLIGSIQVVGKKVVLQFSSINIPGFATSQRISAVAVDLNSSRTAMASDVDNHYFLKYGLLLGSAFIKGWSEAISNQNKTTQVSPFGTVTVQTGDKTNKEINQEALGEVGREIASAVRQEQGALAPTIRVYKDTAIGLLFLDDFIVK